MEQKSLWKNFLLLTVSTLIVAHMGVSIASDETVKPTTQTDSSQGCVLDAE